MLELEPHEADVCSNGVAKMLSTCILAQEQFRSKAPVKHHLSFVCSDRGVELENVL